MADAIVRYRHATLTDTEGRQITELAPLGEGAVVRYRGHGLCVGRGTKVAFEFEISADSADGAFEKFDARRNEEGATVAAEVERQRVRRNLELPPSAAVSRERCQVRRGNGG